MTHARPDEQGYEQLVHDHARDLYRFAYRLCGRADWAEDLVQETFTEAWKSIASLRDVARGKAWLFRILRHRYSHAIRDQSRRIRPTANLEDSQATAAGRDVLDLLADRELLDQALDSLSDAFKQPFLLVFGQDLTCQEAAEVLDIPLGTVLSRIHRARVILRQRLRELGHESHSKQHGPTQHDQTTQHATRERPA